MTEPTQEQIKELWEWCGLKYTIPYWVDEDDNLAFYGEVSSELQKSINPNNLFKYAVPKLEVNQRLELLQRWATKICSDYTLDPALALFWVIWEVKKDR